MKSLCLSLLTLLCLYGTAQQKIPEFGKVDKADLEMKECSFDKNAEALVLFDVGEVYCGFNPNALFYPVTTELERHIRIKILSNKGFDRANIHIPYYGYRNTEHVKISNAQTYNLDASGNIVTFKLDKKLIYDKRINARFSEQVFTLPEVKAGSIVEYKYTISSSWFGGLKGWHFQGSIPVQLSQYTINFPSEFEVLAQPFCSIPFDQKNLQKGDRDIKIFTMKQVPALRDEAFISCDEDYVQKIKVRISAVNSPTKRISLLRTWPSLIKDLMEDEDFGTQLRKDIPRTADLDAQLKTISDPYQRMKTIHAYVKRNMTWNEMDNIYALDGVKSAWKDKKGTSGEINLILVNLLKDAGLDAHPVLVSTKENGMVSTSMADLGQFDKVMAYVTIGNRFYVLDGTDKYTPSNLIPLSVMCSEGLVIEKISTYEWGWKPLWDPAKLSSHGLVLSGKVDENGQMTGEAIATCIDYAKIKSIPDLKMEKAKYIETHFTAANPLLKIEKLDIENQEPDSMPLIQKIKFAQSLASSGEYKYFNLNLFTGLEKNPFVADNRFSDVFFGTNQYYSLVERIEIPENYAFDELPKSMRMIMPDTSIVFSRFLSADGNRLSARITIEFNHPFYTAEEYPEFHEFYKQLFALLNDQIVIKKKTAP